MFSKETVHAPKPRIFGVTMPIHLPGAYTDGEFSLIEATMPPVSYGVLHTPETFDEFVCSAGSPVGEEFTVCRPFRIKHSFKNDG